MTEKREVPPEFLQWLYECTDQGLLFENARARNYNQTVTLPNTATELDHLEDALLSLTGRHDQDHIVTRLLAAGCSLRDLEIHVERFRMKNDCIGKMEIAEERCLDLLDWIHKQMQPAVGAHPYSATFVVTVYTPQACSFGKHKERLHNAFRNHPQFPADITFLHYEAGRAQL